MRKIRQVSLTLLAAGLCAALAGCPGKQSPKLSQDLPYEATKLSFYGADLSLPLESRLGLMPGRVLELYRRMDGRADYAAYMPTAGEKALFMEYLRLMPPAVERLFRERCAGLYFVTNFTGNGITSWALDEKGKMYFTMALNPAAFTRSLSETLTERESSCFIPEEGWEVAVDAGTEYKGLAYSVFHEASHAVDYIIGITPLVDPGVPEASRVKGRLKAEFETIWAEHDRPRPEYDYKLRDRLTFYGFGGGPRIAFRNAARVYDGLRGSPFISLYGSRSWAEDFAELTAFHLITKKLRQPYSISVFRGGILKAETAPASGAAAPRAARAAAELEKI